MARCAWILNAVFDKKLLWHRIGLTSDYIYSLDKYYIKWGYFQQKYNILQVLSHSLLCKIQLILVGLGLSIEILYIAQGAA